MDQHHSDEFPAAVAGAAEIPTSARVAIPAAMIIKRILGCEVLSKVESNSCNEVALYSRGLKHSWDFLCAQLCRKERDIPQSPSALQNGVQVMES